MAASSSKKLARTEMDMVKLYREYMGDKILGRHNKAKKKKKSINDYFKPKDEKGYEEEYEEDSKYHNIGWARV